MFLQGVVFDFDGVLADTEPLHLSALQQVLGPRGIALGRDEYYGRYLGYDDETLLDLLLSDRAAAMPAGDRGAILEEKGRVFRRLVARDPPLMPGVIGRLRDWSSRVPIAIASGALRDEIQTMLRAGGLEGCVHAIVAAGEAPRGKPAPDPYLAAVARLNALCRQPEIGPDPRRHDDPGSLAAPIVATRCVAVEDSRWGIASAKAAGLRVVAVTTSYAAGDLAGADLVVAGVGELHLDQLDRLCAAVAPGREPGR